MGVEQFRGKYLTAIIRGQHLRVSGFDDGLRKVISNEVFFKEEFGRIRDVVVGHDEFIYLAISNRDRRGNPKPEDD